MNRIHPLIPYVSISVALALIYFYLSMHTTYRVGDGSEYYAMYYAWLDTFRPWMTVEAYASYQRLVDRHEIVGMVSSEHLTAAFPSLRVGETADFNHFWFYSFLAFALSVPFQLIGFHLQAHHSFMFLHYVMTLSVILTLLRLYGWIGFVVAVIIVLLSPVVWYMNKVHTELFTVIFSLFAVAFVHRNLYLAGAFSLAVASTQNPSFALIAFIPFFYRIVIQRREPLGMIEIFFAIATALLVLLHPAYYFFRYGVPTPQLLAGGASMGGNISTSYIWLLDPDLGLLAYWPIGIVALALALVLLRQANDYRNILNSEGSLFFFFFVAAFFLINLYAHSSTTNLNSGATRGPARYALWYLPLFLPVFLYVLKKVKGRKILMTAFTIFLLFSAWFNFHVSDPRKSEDYQNPSFISRSIQTYASYLYSPPDEVFAERYSGLGESIHTVRPRAIVGPDCSKVLVYPGNDRHVVISPTKCFFDHLKVKDMVESLTIESSEINPFYARFTNEQRLNAALQVLPGVYQVGEQGSGNFILDTGWSVPEHFGVWSDGSMAKLSLPCSSTQYYFDRHAFRIKLIVQPFGIQDISITHQSEVLYQGRLLAETAIDIELKEIDCANERLELTIYLDSARSPLELGYSNDPRKLGVALIKYELN